MVSSRPLLHRPCRRQRSDFAELCAGAATAVGQLALHPGENVRDPVRATGRLELTLRNQTGQKLGVPYAIARHHAGQRNVRKQRRCRARFVVVVVVMVSSQPVEKDRARRLQARSEPLRSLSLVLISGRSVLVGAMNTVERSSACRSRWS